MYKLEKLPYEYDSLEPFIDSHTLGLHHMKHQKKYLDNLNNLLIKNNYDYKYSLEMLSKHIMIFDKEDRDNILFNLGGVINHNIYFRSISPNKVEPDKNLLNRINEKYNSYNNFKSIFKEKALSIKGSGYTFLVLKDNNLEIVNLLNQDNPYNHNMIPLIGLDMWEHAYYINYENRKSDYIDAFFTIMNFKEANLLFED